MNIAEEALKMARKRIPVPATFAERVHESDMDAGARNGYYMACMDLLPKLDELRKALVECAIPYEAIRMDAESKKWIAPEVWKAIEDATDTARKLVRAK